MKGLLQCEPAGTNQQMFLCCRALGCLLYQMSCLTHAFQGPNFLSVVMKIMEGDTPALPPAYSPDLNSIMRR